MDGYQGTQCGGPDCCDIDPAVHPGVTMWFTQKNNCQDYNYACLSGGPVAEWGSWACTGVACATITDGFVGGTPGCGVTAPWANTCMGLTNMCNPTTTQMVQQACH